MPLVNQHLALEGWKSDWRFVRTNATPLLPELCVSCAHIVLPYRWYVALCLTYRNHDI